MVSIPCGLETKGIEIDIGDCNTWKVFELLFKVDLKLTASLQVTKELWNS